VVLVQNSNQFKFTFEIGFEIKKTVKKNRFLLNLVQLGLGAGFLMLTLAFSVPRPTPSDL